MYPVLPVATIAVGAGTVAGVLYLLAPGRSLSTLAADAEAVVMGRVVPLSSAQQAIRAQIEGSFTSAGLGFLARAAVANAYAESRLDPSAIGDGGAAVGLFQLHDRGLGAGMTVAARQDAAQNIDRVIQESKRHTWTKGATHAALAAEFANKVERCAACGYQAGTAQLVARMALCRMLYGSVADQVAL